MNLCNIKKEDDLPMPLDKIEKDACVSPYDMLFFWSSKNVKCVNKFIITI